MLDTKSTLVAGAIIMFVIYYAYSTSQAQANEIKILQRTLDVMRTFIPKPTSAAPQANRGDMRAETMTAPDPPTEQPTSRHNLGFVPHNVQPANAVAQRPIRRAPFTTEPNSIGIGAGLPNINPNEPLSAANQYDNIPPLPSYQ